MRAHIILCSFFKKITDYGQIFIYLGISDFMQIEKYYKVALKAISMTLENTIGYPKGTIMMK